MPITQINDTTYEVELTGGDKVEIGDKDSTDFKPHIKLNRWGGECFIAVQPAGEIEEEVEAEVEPNKIKYKYKVKQNGFELELESEFYPLEPRTVITKDKEGKDRQFPQNELGGFEFEIILKKKPATNLIIFNIETQGIRFTYQPPLHPDHPTWTQGVVCPENVVGSYAVYHATRTKWHASPEEAEKYKTCKMGQFYYPYLIDAEGWKVRAEDFKIDMEKGLLTITLPQQFLDEAVYPVVIDPDFGYTTIGGGWVNIADEYNSESTRYGSAWPMPAPGGTANYIKAYIGDPTELGNPTDCKVFINQKDSVAAGQHGQIATKENLACPVGEHWEEFTLAGEALTGEVVYILNIIGDWTDVGVGKCYSVAVDANSAVAVYTEVNNYGAPESPWVIDPFETTYDLSIYCNYSEEAPAGLENKSANMAAKMMAAGVL